MVTGELAGGLLGRCTSSCTWHLNDFLALSLTVFAAALDPPLKARLSLPSISIALRTQLLRPLPCVIAIGVTHAMRFEPRGLVG